MTTIFVTGSTGKTWKRISARRLGGGFCLILLLSGCASTPVLQPEPASPGHADYVLRREATDNPRVTLVSMESSLLSDFWGRTMTMDAAIILPADHDPDELLPVCYVVHGFGGSHRDALRMANAMTKPDYPRLLIVWLNATFPLGHHIFADSVNNGPWGAALTEELIPSIEAEFGGYGAAKGRFLTGGSSGGHSTLWLQINYPDFFGGVWAGAPDPVDFRDFTGVNIYEDANVYTDAAGNERMLMRRNGQWVTSIRQYVERELAKSDYGGQYASFDAVFSPRGEDGRQMPLFDRKTGAIDPFVAEAWKKYDLRLIVHDHWAELGPKLTGKLRIYCGTEDTFRLDGALKLFEAELSALGSDAEIVWVEGRDHGIFRPHPDLWPNGLFEKAHREMLETFQHSTGAVAAK